MCLPKTLLPNLRTVAARRKSLRLQQRLAPVEKLNPTVDQGDFFSPLTSISALGDADTDMDNQGFNSRRRRHSVMPTRRTGRGSRASATFSPETVPATQQHNRRSVRTTSKRHKIKCATNCYLHSCKLDSCQ
eukprot:COSAG01_NODE_2430_length_7711_cov_182.453100_3_plen_132_part_00